MRFWTILTDSKRFRPIQNNSDRFKTFKTILTYIFKTILTDLNQIWPIQNDSDWFQMILTNSKWFLSIQNDSDIFKTIQNDSRRNCPTALESVEYVQLVQLCRDMSNYVCWNTIQEEYVQLCWNTFRILQSPHRKNKNFSTYRTAIAKLVAVKKAMR